MFAAAAVSASQNMAELVSAGVQAAVAAFRTGLHSLNMQRDIEPASAGQVQSWSFIASLTESRALQTIEEFAAKKASWPGRCHQDLANSGLATYKWPATVRQCYIALKRYDKWASSYFDLLDRRLRHQSLRHPNPLSLSCISFVWTRRC